MKSKILNERKRIVLLISLMAFLVIIVAGISISILYNTAFLQTRERLVDIAKSRARLIESIAEFNLNNPSGFEGETLEAVLYQLENANLNFKGFGKTGEFTLAHIEDSVMVFLINQRFQTSQLPAPVPLKSNLAEPMRRSLSGESGTLIGYDYRGEIVLAAYEPVSVFNLGIVAKIDMSEVRAPFINAGFIAGLTALVIIALGSLLFIKISKPILHNLEEHEIRINGTFDQAAVGIIHYNLDRKILEVNKKFCELIGYSEEEVLQMNIKNFIHKEDLPIHEQMILKLFQDHITNVNYEKRYIRKDGTITWVNNTVTLVRDYYGAPKYFIVFAEDINQRVEMTIELKEYSEKLAEMVDIRTKELRDAQQKIIRQEKLAVLGQLAGGVGHELRNPLNKLVNAIQYIKNEKDKLSEESREFLSIMENQVDVSTKIVTDLLDFSRVNKSEQRFCKVLEVINRIKEIDKPKHISLEMNLENDLPEIQTDADHLFIILQNLVVNGYQAITEKGKLTVSATKEDKFIKIEIADTGCGMDHDTVSKIFEPLFTTKKQGIGLGLAITANLAKSYDIEINVASELEKGTKFTLMIPVRNNIS